MDIYLLCVLIITAIFSAAGIYLIIVLRALRKSIPNVDSAVERIRAAAENAERTAGQAEVSLEAINSRLPGILDDLSTTAANLKSISEDAAHQFVQRTDVPGNLPAPRFSKAASLGNYVLKGYSVLKRFKKNRYPV